jgi:putative membrane protein
MKLILRLLIIAAALWVTGQRLPDVQLTEDVAGILLVAVIFGLVNALVRPIVSLLALPLTVVTLGLFTLVINRLMLLLTSWLAGDLLSIAGDTLDRLVTAFIGAIIISVVSMLLS